jgi:hypothetical protein
MIDAFGLVKEFGSKQSGVSVQFATVDLAYTSGNPRLVFDGETNASTKTYPHLASFTPTGGERVMVLNGVIIGAIKEW